MNYDLIDLTNKKRSDKEIAKIAKMLNDLSKLDNEIFQDIDYNE